LLDGFVRANVHDMVIAITNSKGGVGKSTVAVHLAGWLSSQGFRVTLADCDPQHSASEWIRQAAQAVTTVILDTPDEILNAMKRVQEKGDFVVADGPGSQTEVSRALLLKADFALVPCKASMLEVRALAKATEVLRQAQEIRGGKPQAVAVLSMVGSRYKLTQDMKEAAEALGLPLARSCFSLRQIYADAPGQGKLVWDFGGRGQEAAAEASDVFEEIFGEMIAGMKPGPLRVNE
jgi:chromosome partitioning protein